MLSFQQLQIQYRDAIINIGKKHGISNIRVFGSVVRGDNDENSDLDLLVDVEENKSLFDISWFCLELEDLMGCKIDFNEAKAIKHPILVKQIFSEAVDL